MLAIHKSPFEASHSPSAVCRALVSFSCHLSRSKEPRRVKTQQPRRNGTQTLHYNLNITRRVPGSGGRYQQTATESYSVPAHRKP